MVEFTNEQYLELSKSVDKALAAVRAALAVERSEEALAEHPMDYDQGFVDGVEAQLAEPDQGYAKAHGISSYEPVKQEPVSIGNSSVSFPKELDATNKWIVDYDFLNKIYDMVQFEGVSTNLPAIEAVLIAVENIYAAPVQPVKQEPTLVPFTKEQVERYATAFDKAFNDTGLKQEPVACVDANEHGIWADILPDRDVKVGQLLYAAPVDAKAIRSEALEDAVKFLGEVGMIAPNGLIAASIRGLK